MTQNRTYSSLSNAGDSALQFDFPNIPVKRKREAFVLFLLAFFGIFGFIYVIDCMNQDSSQAFAVQHFNSQIQEAGLYNKKLNSTEAIEMEGELSVQKPISIKLVSYKKNHTYFINFGDGTNQQMTMPKIIHKYQSQGNFIISVATINSKNQTSYFTKEINIK